MAIVNATKSNLESILASNDTVFVDFWATWCGPRKTFAPVFEKASENHPEIVFAKIDTDAEQELAAAFDIQSIPTIMAFRERVLLYARAGALPAPAFEELINKVQELDMAAVHKEIAEQESAEEDQGDDEIDSTKSDH